MHKKGFMWAFAIMVVAMLFAVSCKDYSEYDVDVVNNIYAHTTDSTNSTKSTDVPDNGDGDTSTDAPDNDDGGGDHGGEGENTNKGSVTVTAVQYKGGGGYLITLRNPRVLTTNIHEDLVDSDPEVYFPMVNEKQFLRYNLREMERKNPGYLVISMGYYNSNSSPYTKLAFPARFVQQNGTDLTIKGEYGAPEDRNHRLSAIVWNDEKFAIEDVGTYDELHLPNEPKANYLVGFADGYGKDAGSRTGRTIMGINNDGNLLILVMSGSYQSDATEFIEQMGAIQIVTISGGRSSQFGNNNDVFYDDIKNLANGGMPCYALIPKAEVSVDESSNYSEGKK